MCRVARSCSSALAALTLCLQTLDPPASLRAFGNQPLVLALIHERGLRVETDPFVLAAVFNLTPGEARVAAAIAQGQSLQDITATHRISINTVRTQLRSIFGKTGVVRQSDLVSLLAALPL